MSPGFYSFESALTCFTGWSIYSRTSSGPTHPLPGPGECRRRRGHRDQGVVGLAPGIRASTDSGIKSWTGLASACQVGPRSGQASLPCHGVRLVSCWPQGQERRVLRPSALLSEAHCCDCCLELGGLEVGAPGHVRGGRRNPGVWRRRSDRRQLLCPAQGSF